MSRTDGKIEGSTRGPRGPKKWNRPPHPIRWQLVPVRKVISSYDDDDIDGNDSDDDDIDDNYIDDDIDSDSDKEPGAWHSCSDARA